MARRERMRYSLRVKGHVVYETRSKAQAQRMARFLSDCEDRHEVSITQEKGRQSKTWKIK